MGKPSWKRAVIKDILPAQAQIYIAYRHIPVSTKMYHIIVNTKAAWKKFAMLYLRAWHYVKIQISFCSCV